MQQYTVCFITEPSNFKSVTHVFEKNKFVKLNIKLKECNNFYNYNINLRH